MKKILLTMVLLAAGTAASFASANKLSRPETEAEALLLRCCKASAVDAETGEVIQSVEVCGGDSDAEFIMSCNQANSFLNMLMKAPE